MKKFLKEIFAKIKNLDKNINSYKIKTQSVFMPSKAYLNWGINLALEGKINDAIEKFEMSSNMSVTDPESFLNWGIALAKLHRFEEAVQKFDEALKVDKTYSSAYSLKGAALVELNKHEEALDCYKMAVKYAPFDPEIYVNWGVALARLNQKSKAEVQFKKALGLSLHNVNASFLLGVVLYEQNKLDEASEAFKYTVSIDNTHAMAFYYLSLTYTKLEKYKEALQCAKITVQLVPFRIDFMVNLAECYYDEGKIKNAIRTYHSIKLISPEAYPLLISAGIFWQKVKKFQKSIKYLEKAIKKPQADILTKYYLAVSYAGDNRLIDSKNLFLDILKENPDFHDASIKLAILYKSNEDYDFAINLFENVFSKTKQYTQYYKFLADCYRLKGSIDKAMEYYHKMLEYYPHDIDVQIELAQIYFTHLKDYKNATRMIRTAYKQKKDDVKINTLFALILAEDGYIDNAIEKINAAIVLDENNIDTYLRKAYILKKSKHNSQYHEFIDFLKTKFPEHIQYIQSVLTSY